MIKYNAALVIDGDPISNFVTAMTLERIKMAKEIKTSRSLLHSIDKIIENIQNNETPPDLIILDLLYNEEELISFFENFKSFKDNKKVKLVLLTLASERGIKKAETYGYPYIKRPVTEDKLISIL